VDLSYYSGHGLFFEVPLLASDALLTTLHALLENVLQTVCHKLQDSGTGGFESTNFSNGPRILTAAVQFCELFLRMFFEIL
jgi:hypothetical protein